jgi:hypothetical protein
MAKKLVLVTAVIVLLNACGPKPKVELTANPITVKSGDRVVLTVTIENVPWINEVTAVEFGIAEQGKFATDDTPANGFSVESPQISSDTTFTATIIHTSNNALFTNEVLVNVTR